MGELLRKPFGDREGQREMLEGRQGVGVCKDGPAQYIVMQRQTQAERVDMFKKHR